MKTAKNLILAFLVSTIFCPSSPAAAEPARTLRVETTNYLVSSQQLPVGDREGHSIGIGKREGEATFPNGETAKHIAVYSFDFLRSGGLATVYATFLFDDNSTIVTYCTEEVSIENGAFSKQGEGTILKGTGRFAGLTGKLTLSGKSLKPANQDPKLTTTTTYLLTLE